jgi:hypothetical protein
MNTVLTAYSSSKATISFSVFYNQAAKFQAASISDFSKSATELIKCYSNFSTA